MRRALALVLAAGLAAGAPLAAATQDAAQPPRPASAIDATKLGVDLSRIRSGLEKSTDDTRWSADELRLDTRIQVFGQAPLPDFFESFDPVDGPVPFGAPTHGQMLDMATPAEFKAPSANFAGLAFWAIQKLGDRRARQRCEEELARYRRQVLAGIDVAAPACAR